jgi:hypothetical protein
MKTQPIFRTFECNAAKRKLNLQLFAEPAPEVEVHEEPNGSGDDSNPEIDIDALRVQLAQANAQIAKLTNKADALASENAAKTKQLREKMTAQEQEAEAKKEAEAEREKQFKEMQRKLLVIESTSTYMDILEMSKETAQQYAEARADGDADKENDILRQHMKAFKAKMMQSFLAERGEVNTGHGDSGESKAVELLKMLPKSSGGVDESILKAYM